MHQVLDSIAIALRAIWSSKLRSFMTVLGNIVAVTSIVTVVSLIQGVNAMVSSAIITDVGADGFTVQRTPITRTEEEEEQNRNGRHGAPHGVSWLWAGPSGESGASASRRKMP